MNSFLWLSFSRHRLHDDVEKIKENNGYERPPENRLRLLIIFHVGKAHLSQVVCLISFKIEDIWDSANCERHQCQDRYSYLAAATSTSHPHGAKLSNPPEAHNEADEHGDHVLDAHGVPVSDVLEHLQSVLWQVPEDCHANRKNGRSAMRCLRFWRHYRRHAESFQMNWSAEQGA